MESKLEKEEKISRKKFLHICGSVVAGGSILGVTGGLLWKMVNRPDEVFFGVDGKGTPVNRHPASSFRSPYRLVSAFKAPDRIEAFELVGDRLIVAVPDGVCIYDASGKHISRWAVAGPVRDMAVDKENLYLLYPTRVEVYDLEEGHKLREWEACSEESDYCSFTVAAGNVFVTDAGHKNICKYTAEGDFVKFIESPAGFIVPSYSFGITNIEGVIYCSNPGRHTVESYSQEGEYIASFGKAGGAEGLFSGCCNPVYLTATPTGEIITSEKGIPRISCYGKTGEFHSVLLDEKMLGGGHAAYEVRVWKDKLIVAGKDRVATYQYDKKLALQTVCSSCGIDCPLREGVII